MTLPAWIRSEIATVDMFSLNPKSAVVRGALLIVCILWTVPARACDVPVFRYALEVWPPNPYDVIVYHRGPLTPDHNEVIDMLKADCRTGEGYANLVLHLADLDKLPENAKSDLWQGQPEPDLPRMVVRYPQSPPDRPHMWSGALTNANADLLVDSPKRREVAQRLAKGDTAVWVLLEIGDKTKDNAAAELLRSQLDALNKTLKLPELTMRSAFGQAKKLPTPEIDISFSLLRLSRTDPKERLFVQMLLSSEPDLATFKEPMVFPIFGRGRVLYALVGAGISKSNIEKGCHVITGPCTCEIKDLNIGTDMLMNMDWESSLDKTFSQLARAPVLPSLSDVKAAVSRPRDQQKTDDEQKVSREPAALKRNTAFVLIAAVAVIGFVSAVLVTKKGHM